MPDAAIRLGQWRLGPHLPLLPPRPEAARAALALFRLNGGEDCHLAHEMLPDRTDRFDTCGWTLTAHQWGIKAGYDGLTGTSALALSRSGHAGFAEHGDVNMAGRIDISTLAIRVANEPAAP